MSSNIFQKDKHPLDREYPAVVDSIDMSLNDGTINVKIPPLLGDDTISVKPEHTNGVLTTFYMPEEGDIVSVKFPHRDINSGKWFGGEPCGSGTDAFKTSYPDVYGFSDRYGNSVRINRKTGVLNVKTSMHVVADTSTFTCTGDVVIQGNLIVQQTSNLMGATTIQEKAFMPHAHSNGNEGANTGGVV